MNDTVLLVGVISSALTAIAGLFVAFATRRKLDSEAESQRSSAAYQITQAAEKIVGLREKDIIELEQELASKENQLMQLSQTVHSHELRIAELQRDVAQLKAKCRKLIAYVRYLHAFTGDTNTKTLEQFTEEE